ncbi:hypothetical protein KCP76_17310 [Salmonella enterica subsp. enterica serovar Weltevreden]|nr:hypothetical protein KCP76_17310 [Salmonella enterica subsp. enterica serovar Weltevreden]
MRNISEEPFKYRIAGGLCGWLLTVNVGFFEFYLGHCLSDDRNWSSSFASTSWPRRSSKASLFRQNFAGVVVDQMQGFRIDLRERPGIIVLIFQAIGMCG